MHKAQTRRQFLKRTSLAAGAALMFSCGPKPKRPNIIFLLTDDQRWDMLGCMGNDIIKTPNIDKMAAEGVIFDNMFVTTSICCTSRASILSGQYARRHGIHDFGTNFTPAQMADTYPMVLKRAGYRVGFIGKYGVGNTVPEQQFDFWRGVPGQPKYENVDENGEPIHYTKLCGAHAHDFFKDAHPEQPFCLSISFKAPHVQDGDPRQFIPDPAYSTLYENDFIPPPEKAQSKYLNAMPAFMSDDLCMLRVRWQLRFSNDDQYQQMVKNHYRLITGVDVVVGHIRNELKVRGLADNTVIIFTGDNGFYLGEYGFAGKWLGHEESIRVPLVVYDPRAKKSQRGQRREESALNIDIAPTILKLAGETPPENMQGRSLTPLLAGKKSKWRDDFFYEHLFRVPEAAIPRVGYIPASVGVRTKQWKYLRYIDQYPVFEELYDLKNDPSEIYNLSANQQFAAQLDHLRTRCDQMLHECE